MEKKTLTWRLTCKFRDDETIEDGRLNLESFICERNAWRLVHQGRGYSTMDRVTLCLGAYVPVG